MKYTVRTSGREKKNLCLIQQSIVLKGKKRAHKRPLVYVVDTFMTGISKVCPSLNASLKKDHLTHDIPIRDAVKLKLFLNASLFKPTNLVPLLPPILLQACLESHVKLI